MATKKRAPVDRMSFYPVKNHCPYCKKVILREGDKGLAICPHCEKNVFTTFKYAKYKINGKTIPNVLQGFCDECGKPITIPHQSSMTIRDGLK
jgi:predicted amidophosphoribosyltransferase